MRVLAPIEQIVAWAMRLPVTAFGPWHDVRAAYNRAKRILQRRGMMQAWAGYLDRLMCDGNFATKSPPEPNS
jgi:hypothetical protein